MTVFEDEIADETNKLVVMLVFYTVYMVVGAVAGSRGLIEESLVVLGMCAPFVLILTAFALSDEIRWLVDSVYDKMIYLFAVILSK